MAKRDETAPHGLRRRIEDYPNAADGLLVWDSIEAWIKDYVSLYYADSNASLEDAELQAWWNGVITKDHGDKKMQNGSHAAVNFGQYDCTTTPASIPTSRASPGNSFRSRHDPQFQRLIKNPHKFMLETLPSQEQVMVVMMVVESLSTHSPDEEYLGYNSNHTNWASDERVVKAFQAFSKRLAEVDKKIIERIKHLNNKHRAGYYAIRTAVAEIKPWHYDAKKFLTAFLSRFLVV